MQTRKYPRTLNEAFGPYTSQHIEDPDHRMDRQDVIVVVGCAIIAGVVLLMCLAGWIV